MTDELEAPDLELVPLIKSISDILWKQKDGELIRLGDMNDQHLRNTALMLFGMGYQTYNAPNDIKVKWLTALRMEWERRKNLQ